MVESVHTPVTSTIPGSQQHLELSSTSRMDLEQTSERSYQDQCNQEKTEEHQETIDDGEQGENEKTEADLDSPSDDSKRSSLQKHDSESTTPSVASVRLQKDGGKLSLLDIYDACTRGVGGIVRVIGSLFRADFILISGSLLQLALLAMNPAGQQVLSSTIGGEEMGALVSGTALYKNHPAYSDMTGVSVTYDLSEIKGHIQAYLVQAALEQTSLGYSLSALKIICPYPAVRCEYDDIPVYHIGIDCQPASLQTKVLDSTNGNLTTVNDLLGFNSTKPSFLQPIFPTGAEARHFLPQFYYAESMVGRTHWDLAKIPISEGHGEYNPNARNLIGDQTFVMAAINGTTKVGRAKNDSSTTIFQCTLRSYLNATKVSFSPSNLDIKAMKSDPVTIDYELLSNNSKLEALAGGKDRLGDDGVSILHFGNFTQTNAYGLQLSVMKALTSLTAEIGAAATMWSIGSSPDLGPVGQSSIFDFLGHWMKQTGINSAFSAPHPSMLQSLPATGQNFNTGLGYIVLPLLYNIEPAQYLGVVLSFLVPLVWWVSIWIISLYQTNGLSRGNSQIALLATGFTEAARKEFGEYSHASQGSLFSRADKIDVCFGETPSVDGKPGQVAFGLKQEGISMLRHRRGSVDHNHNV
ncbi:hypothetical protein DFQ28_010880 [Apophysomyces sp. BC1034]|nr:hypothetical protein DFQ28_010880 [Apophysomyces sp. BC1034]